MWILGLTLKQQPRCLDALDISAAVEYHCNLFISGDIRQKEIAEKMGLAVEIV